MKDEPPLILLLLLLPLFCYAPFDYTETTPISVQNNSLLAVSPVEVIKPVTLACVAPGSRLERLGERITYCENPNNERCNVRYGCRSGIGKWMLIPSTAAHCAEEMGRPIDPFNEADNDACGWWLLKNEGWEHWGYPPDDPRGYINGMRWGTYDCFKDYLR